MGLKIFGRLFIIAGLIGCKEINIQDGHIPQQYLADAEILTGKYHGTLNGRNAEIDIYIEGDRPLLQYNDSLGMDILSSNCSSKIGLLKKIQALQNNEKVYIDEVLFGFDPGQCAKVVGNEVILKFIEKNKIKMSIHQYDERIYQCTPGRSGGCAFVYVPHFLTGIFSRE